MKVGSYDDTKGDNHGLIGPMEAGCPTVDDPYAYGTIHQLPDPETGGVDTIEMAEGVYVLKNSVWKFNGLMTGKNVTITGSDSYLNTNGQGTIDIQAPTDTTSKYKGILMYEAYGIRTLSSMHINGGQQALVKGLIYLPSRDMKWNGNSGVDSDGMTLILNSLEVTGTTTWRLAPFETFGITAVESGGTTEQVLSSVKLSAN